MTSGPAPPADSRPTRHLGILLFDDVEELDAVGPWEVLAHWTREYPEDGYAVCCLSRDGRAVTAAKGLTLGAHYSMRDAPALQVLVHPGGQGTRPLLRDPAHLTWVRQQRQAVPLMTSVCTGSLVAFDTPVTRLDRPARSAGGGSPYSNFYQSSRSIVGCSSSPAASRKPTDPHRSCWWPGRPP